MRRLLACLLALCPIACGAAPTYAMARATAVRALGCDEVVLGQYLVREDQPLNGFYFAMGCGKQVDLFCYKSAGTLDGRTGRMTTEGPGCELHGPVNSVSR